MSLGSVAKMEFSVRCRLRILSTVMATLVFLSRSSAAPSFGGGTDGAMVSLFIYVVIAILISCKLTNVHGYLFILDNF